MHHRSRVLATAIIAVFGALLLSLPFAGVAAPVAGSGWTLIGWNDLGMHCMDSDYSVFSILPPYNTVHAQLVGPAGLITAPGEVTVTYQAVADPAGSINTTSVGKTGFWTYAGALFGVSPPPDTGLAGSSMPGAANLPQPMAFEGGHAWFTAEGVPLTPYDDELAGNPYPMMRLIARDGGGALLAATDVVLPVSDEMDCSACHASGTVTAAEPAGGWVNDPDPERDYRLNVLALHDDLEGGTAVYQQALADAGYSADGLYVTVTAGATPILCARCHGSNALPGTGLAGLSPLTAAVHDRHAAVIDPTNGMPLDASDNRTACYRCHPGSATRCLRGAMGKAVATDGALAIECQSCHGTMSRVGDPARVGWLEEPACQGCHTGTAVDNNGQIRYLTVYEPGGAERLAVDATFATQPDAPAPGFDLYRFSYGHGGLACEACHGSTHAVYPASHGNDNVQSTMIQGHAGTLVECAACHTLSPQTVSGGPHGLHPVGPVWVEDHGDAAEGGGATACRACHGTDYRGTVLSYSQSDWTASTEYGAKDFWRGFRISCWACHDGPDSEDPSPDHPAVVTDLAAETESGVPVPVTLVASDPDGDPLELRIVSQPAHGTVGLAGLEATYYPEPGYAGGDAFTYAAWDGWTDSNLGSVVLTVAAGSCPPETCLFADGFESGDATAWSRTVPVLFGATISPSAAGTIRSDDRSSRLRPDLRGGGLDPAGAAASLGRRPGL